MSDNCGTKVTFEGVTDEGNGQIAINFFVETADCEPSAGRITYTYVDNSAGWGGKIRDRNSIAWDAALGNHFFLRDKIPNLATGDVQDVQITDITCGCA